MRMRSRKRGMFSMEVFTKITFVVMILFMFFFVGNSLYAAVFGGGSDRDTKANFESLAQNVQLLISKTSSFEYQNMIFYMKDMHLIIGFNPGLPSESLGFTIKGIIPNKPIANEYPKDCHNKPCLCFYAPSSIFPAKPTKCQTFDSPIVFHGFGRNEIKFVDGAGLFDGKQKTVLTFTLKKQDSSIYNDYPVELRMDYETLGLAVDKDFTQSLYIEKYVANGKTHILISPYLEEAVIDKRISLLAACPDSSDDFCIGKKRNAYLEGTKDYCSYDPDNNKCILKSGVEDCKLDEKITKTCICGTEFLDMDYALKGATRYCFKMSSSNNLIALPLNCTKISESKSCPEYCKSMTPWQDDCDSDEITYCTTNRCNLISEEPLTCMPYDANGKHYCKNA